MLENTSLIRYDLVLGSRRASNYIWLIIVFLGSIGFLDAGISSYFKTQILPFIKTDSISFLPQGIVMTFYGTVGFLLCLLLAVSILYNVGGGYNKYDVKQGKIEIFRLGFPGITKELYLSYLIKDIKSIKLSITEGLNPRHEIYLSTKDGRRIPLTRVGEPLLLSIVESEAVDLSSFLNIPLESS
jgi:hypothetical protein